MRVSVPRIPRQCYCLNASTFFCNNTINTTISLLSLSSSQKIKISSRLINPLNKQPKYYEIAQFSSFLMTGEEKEKEKELGIIIASESHPQIQTAPQQEREITQTQTEATESEEEDDDAVKSEEQNDDVDEPTVSVSEDDDGFRTPTSSDHRIPPITQCPPAPKKLPPPPSKLKRKAPGSSRTIQLDESIFSPIAKDEDDAPPHKIKKARTDD